MNPNVWAVVTDVAKGVGDVSPTAGQDIASVAAQISGGAAGIGAAASGSGYSLTALETILGLSGTSLLILAALFVLLMYLLLRR